MYVPLRVHSHHSLLTGVDPPRRLLERARSLGLPALALADTDTLGGLVSFLRAAEVSDSPRPIVAAELSDVDGRPGRLVALVRTEAGYRNLCRLTSARHLGRDPGEPPNEDEDDPNFDLVHAAARHSDGLTFLADHPRLLLGLFDRIPTKHLFAAISPASLGRGARPGAHPTGRARNTHLAPPPRPELHGDDDIEPHEGPKTPPPARAVPATALVDAARAVGVATLAVPDVYWTAPADAADHRVRVAIKHAALLDDLPAEWVAEGPAHLPSDAEMRALYADLPDVRGPWPPTRGDAPGTVSRTLDVAEECRWTPTLGGVALPEVELAEGETAYSKLCELAFDGLRRRYRPLRPEVVRRLDYELATIHRLGFAPYFLLVESIVRYAKREGIPYVGRGSAADSLVAYAMGLTDADPFRYRLPFERFLNPARRDRPDIDLDFCWRRRDEVLEHVYELAGRERTAMISTVNRFAMRSAFRDAALVHGIAPAELGRWSKRLPAYGGPPASAGTAPLPPALARNPIALALASTPEASDFPFDDDRFVRALTSAERLLDAPRHFGLHPGGVVVSPGRITDYLPCQRAAKGCVVTQLDKDGVEAIGLVKMDLLGNRALTVIDDCLAELAGRGVEVDLDAIPEDDTAVATTLREGRTLGCFQIESPAMRHLLRQTGARTMDDVIQAIALIRPGPSGSGMKDAYVRRFRGLEDPTPPHPRLVDVLWDTHGVMLYQEDVMEVASRVAGMDLAEADQLRRALGTRRRTEVDALRERFLAGCAGEGIEPEAGERVWQAISNFASFAFCKAHAVTYGRIAYRAAWLKAHHPAAYLVAFLASETGYYPPRVYVEEARRLGVAILPPDVNRSGPTFTAARVGDRETLRVGLGQVKGLSGRTLEAILRTREDDGPFLSLPDFLERTGAHTDEVESLVRCGSFDAFDRTRPELLWRLHLLCTPPTRVPRDARLDSAELTACRRHTVASALARTRGGSAAGDDASLFPEPELPAPALPGLPDPDPATRGRGEYELLGLTLDAHPVSLFPCPADDRIVKRFGRRAAPARGAFHSSSEEVRPVNPIPCGRLEKFQGARVTLRGWPDATRLVHTEGGEAMRFLTLEDESGLAEVVLFPDVYRNDGRRLVEGGVLCVTGVVEDQMGACNLRAERIW